MSGAVKSYTSVTNFETYELEVDAKERTTKFGGKREDTESRNKDILKYFRGFGESKFEVYDAFKGLVNEEGVSLIDYEDETLLIECMNFFHFYMKDGSDIESIADILYEILLEGVQIPWDLDYLEGYKNRYIATSDYSLIVQDANYQSDTKCGFKGCKSLDVVVKTMQTRGGDENWTTFYNCAQCGASRSK